MDHYHRSFVRQAQREDDRARAETRTVDLTAVILSSALLIDTTHLAEPQHVFYYLLLPLLPIVS